MLITSRSSWANLSCFSWLRAARPRKRWEHNSPQFKTGKREANLRPIASWDRNHSTNERTPFTMCLPSLPRQCTAQCKQTVDIQWNLWLKNCDTHYKSQYPTFRMNLHGISFGTPHSHFPLGTPQISICPFPLGREKCFLFTPEEALLRVTTQSHY